MLVKRGFIDLRDICKKDFHNACYMQHVELSQSLFMLIFQQPVWLATQLTFPL